jgi:predicted transposase/invertase (TIGR01784 family)
MIGILDFIFDEDKALKDREVIHYVSLKNQHNQLFYDKLLYIYLAMPNFKKEVHDLATYLDKWLYILRNLQNLSDIPIQLRGGKFIKLFQVADMANLSKEERTDYISSLKYYRDMKNVTDTAFEEGEKEGIIKGEKQGIIKGEKKGEQKEKLKNIKKAIKRGKLTDAEIAEDFDVSIEYVQKLRTSLS